MKTLKLTDAEWVTLKEVYLFHPIFPNKDGLLDVDDVDEFREFLNDEIIDIIGICRFNDINLEEVANYNNLKSILNKLN